MTRMRYGLLTVLLISVALMLAGCGGDDNGGLSAADMARIDAAEADAAAAHADAEALEEKLDELEAELAAVDTDDDTSALDDAIAALQTQIAALTAKTADPETPLAILDGTKSTASANDRAALAKKIAGQLNGRYDNSDPKDMSPVNLPDIAATTGDQSLSRNVAHAVGGKIMSGDGTSTDKGFLRHSFTGGPTVDLTSPGDIETLKMGNLLMVNGVDLKSFSLKETDKVRMQTGGAFAAGNAVYSGTGTDTVTTTLGVDGSSHVVVKNSVGTTQFSETITYGPGGSTIEYNANIDGGGIDPVTANTVSRARGVGSIAGSQIARVARADGDFYTVTLDGTNNVYQIGTTAYDPENPTWTPRGTTALPAANQVTAKAAYANAGAAYTIAQHNAKGYGAWLSDSFFAAYVMNAEDDDIIQDPDSTVMKIAWGGRAHDSDPAANLSGRGETAMWKGLMVGHDMDADAATNGMMVKGNAMITARVGEATLADQSKATAPDIVDLSLTNIITADGTAVSRVADGIHWTNLDLTGGEFAKGSEVMGTFYDNGNEVVGEFNKEDIMGVFGAMEYDMPAMDDTMDTASN